MRLGHPDITQVAVPRRSLGVTEDDIQVTAVLRAGSALKAELFEWPTDRFRTRAGSLH